MGKVHAQLATALLQLQRTNRRAVEHHGSYDGRHLHIPFGFLHSKLICSYVIVVSYFWKNLGKDLNGQVYVKDILVATNHEISITEQTKLEFINAFMQKKINWATSPQRMLALLIGT